jgi:tellurite resistance protein TehA-like permease
MKLGNVLLLIGLIVVIIQFIISFEYPTLANTGIGIIIALGSLIIIVLGALLLRRSTPDPSI